MKGSRKNKLSALVLQKHILVKVILVIDGNIFLKAEKQLLREALNILAHFI
jgi:hypothetical protein